MSQKHNDLFRYRFTDGELQQLAKIYQAGHSIDSINRAYGFSFRSRVVENALKRSGIEIRAGRRKIPLSKEAEIVELYKGGLSIYKLSEIYGIWPAPIAKLLERNGCGRRDNRVLSDEQEALVIQEYLSGKSIWAVGEQFGIDGTTVPLILKRYSYTTRPAGHNSRQYQLNEQAFDDLSNEETAYHLGYIYADGGINKETLTVGLSIKDLSHLGKLKSFLSYEAPIEPYKAKTPKGVLNDYCRLSVHSKVLIARLRGLGIIKKRPNFSLLLNQLPKESYRHFIRGVVDGDGTLDRSKRNNARLRILGQSDLLEWISETLHLELGLPIRTIFPRPGIYAIEYGGAAQARKAITWLYLDAMIFLERKINRMEWWNENGPSS